MHKVCQNPAPNPSGLRDLRLCPNFEVQKRVQKQLEFELLKLNYFNCCANCWSISNRLWNGERQLCVCSLICILNVLGGTDSVWEPFLFFFRDSNLSCFWTLFGLRNLGIVWDLLNLADLELDFGKLYVYLSFEGQLSNSSFLFYFMSTWYEEQSEWSNPTLSPEEPINVKQYSYKLSKSRIPK